MAIESYWRYCQKKDIELKKYRVIQWCAGYTGTMALKYIFGNPALELVGVYEPLPDKDGKDAGELCGIGPKGIRATSDKAAILALQADCVVFMPRDFLTDPSLPDSPSKPWVDDLVAILESGKNVITSICTGTHWRHLARGEEFRDRLNAACKKGNSTVQFSGFDPGFATDALAYTLSGVVGDIEQIRIWEIIDVATYTAIPSLQQLGFGQRPQDLPPEGAKAVVTGWGGALHLLGDALGVAIEDLKAEFDIFLAPKDYVTVGGLEIKQGTIGAIRWSLSAIVDGRPRFVIKKITRAGNDVAPDWPRIGKDGGYCVEIDAFPPIKSEMPMGLSGGTGATFSDAMWMTAARLVNSIESVVQAEPGYHTFLKLPPLGGKYALKR